MTKLNFKLVGIVAAVVLAVSSPALATPILSPVSTLGGPAIDFEGFAEGTIITNQYAGVTFGQTDGGTPMIDNSPFLFGYTSSSGAAVLTGSTNGGAPFPTVAGLTATFALPLTAVEFFLSDTAPLGNYTINAYGAGGVFLESLLIPLAAPIGSYVGFTRATGDIVSIDVDSDVLNDAFGIDDVRFTAVPEPASMLLLGTGLAGLAARRYRNRRNR